jgi:hypothetical protein
MRKGSTIIDKSLWQEYNKSINLIHKKMKLLVWKLNKKIVGFKKKNCNITYDLKKN